jgi:hypothetical protein
MKKYQMILEYYGGTFPLYLGTVEDAYEYLVQRIEGKRHLALIRCQVKTSDNIEWFDMKWSEYVNNLTRAERPTIEQAYIPN